MQGSGSRPQPQPGCKGHELGGRVWGGRRGWEVEKEIKDDSGAKPRNNQVSLERGQSWNRGEAGQDTLVPSCPHLMILGLYLQSTVFSSLGHLSDFLACGQWWLPQAPSPLRADTYYQTPLSLSRSPENQPLCCLEPRHQTELTGQATGWLCPQVK